MAAAEPPSMDGPTTPPALPQKPAAPPRRLARPAMLGAVLVTISLILLIQTLAGFFSAAFTGRFNNPERVLAFLLWPTVLTLSMALVGTVLGWVGLAKIRRANGQCRGLVWGTAAALTWPLLVFTILGVLMPAGMITGVLERQGEHVGPVILLSGLGIAVAMDLVVLLIVPRWAAAIKRAQAALAPGERLAIRQKPTLAGLLSFAYIAAAVLMGVLTIKGRIEHAQGGQNPEQPEGFDTPTPAPVPVRADRPTALRPVPIAETPPLKPGESLHARYALFPEPDATTELRITFWSNGLPVDLPGLTLKQKFAIGRETGVPAEWELQLHSDGSHYVLSGPKLDGADGSSTTEAAKLELPDEVQLLAVPDDGNGIHPRPSGPTRRWLFLSSDDAQMGARMNANWAVSLDLFSRRLVGGAP